MSAQRNSDLQRKFNNTKILAEIYQVADIKFNQEDNQSKRYSTTDLDLTATILAKSTKRSKSRSLLPK